MHEYPSELRYKVDQSVIGLREQIAFNDIQQLQPRVVEPVSRLRCARRTEKEAYLEPKKIPTVINTVYLFPVASDIYCKGKIFILLKHLSTRKPRQTPSFLPQEEILDLQHVKLLGYRLTTSSCNEDHAALICTIITLTSNLQIVLTLFQDIKHQFNNLQLQI